MIYVSVFSVEKQVLKQPQSDKMVVRVKRINKFDCRTLYLIGTNINYYLNFPGNGNEYWFSLLQLSVGTKCTLFV